MCVHQYTGPNGNIVKRSPHSPELKSLVGLNVNTLLYTPPYEQAPCHGGSDPGPDLKYWRDRTTGTTINVEDILLLFKHLF